MSPKFRLLAKDELQALEKEFIDYLVVNGITASDWEKMKVDQHEKAEEIVMLFSDVVFESIFRKVQYLEFRQAREIICFQCLPDKLVLVGMKAGDSPEVDFNSQEFINKAMVDPPSDLQVYTTNKPYKKTREIELFEMTLAGCIISDGRVFKALCLSLGKE